MWTKNKSLILTLVLTVIMLVLLTAAVFFVPYFIGWYVDTFERFDIPVTTLLAFFYSCVPFGYIALGILLKLVLNLRKEKIFYRKNISLLRVLSWCCFAVGVACLIGEFFYLPFFIVAVAAVFAGLIIRVIKSIMAYGTDIKDDNDLTI